MWSSATVIKEKTMSLVQYQHFPLYNLSTILSKKALIDIFSSNTAILIYILLLTVVVSACIISMIFNKNNEDTARHDQDQNEQTGAVKPQNEQTAQRFCMLNEIDSNAAAYSRRSYEGSLTLSTLCDDFRNFAASRLSLYYSIDDIRKLVAGLAVSKLIIIQGISGTGKTSLAHAFGSFVDNPSTIIPVQPMWKERTDLLGYYNEFTKRFNESQLLIKMYEANYSNDIYVTVLDEMNIARVEYYFAEFLSLLELPNSSQRYVNVVSDRWSTDPKQLVDGRIKLPDNMWFIGTANNDDSTFAISDKVYDRAMIIALDSKNEEFSAPPTAP
ncbi:MAG: hypothetical protein E7312_06740, partial [Clostridiales bacterium]|nr:hypothetical protein [Clostridiales bacterium]